jgi:hypothetical protein
MSDFDIQIQVNGSRCKQYHHLGKIFIEAKENSEYSIEVKNNTWKRIMAVCSVDGLSILDGKPALEESTGYIINGYSSNKYDGFRVSDDKIAKFVFTTKEKKDGYASDKDSTQQDVGVLGVRIYEEKQPVYNQYSGILRSRSFGTSKPYPSTPTIWCGDPYGQSYGCIGGGINSVPNINASFCASNAMDDSVPVGSLSFNTSQVINNVTLTSQVDQTSTYKSSEIKPKGFDMATKWGAAKESKVVNVSFERGYKSLEVEIFYASRQSLIEMGVPIGSEKLASFPKSFADDKYAKPPKNWVG